MFYQQKSLKSFKMEDFKKEVRQQERTKELLKLTKLLNKEVRRINEAFDQFADGEANGRIFLLIL